MSFTYQKFVQIVCLFFLFSCRTPSPPELSFPLTLTYKGQTVVAEDSLRILIIGNSITRNSPLPQIGWPHDWGMAASAQEKDFVHVLFNRINTHPKVDGKGVLRYDNLATFERDFYMFDSGLMAKYFGQHREYNPDLVIFRWGDNTFDSVATQYNFQDKFSEVITYLKGNARKVPLFVVTSTWYPRPVTNQQISNVCDQHDIYFVDLGEMRYAPGLSAERIGKFSDGGVASHPSDQGMQAIADSLYQAVLPMMR